MSARRQSSTTSLAQYARTTSPDTSNRNLDFCNAFWGPGDGGVDVLFARMRGAARTMEELKNFWKERSAIEEDYAKRLAKLAKMSIGKDEIGELRNSIDTLRLETDKQAGYHSQLAQQLRTDLEGQAGAFAAKQQHHKKIYQAAIEKEYKVKQTREQHASKAREKYESDCLRINSYTAQSTLVQGKDLEKIHLKLERAQQTVQVNENDYAQFTRVLQETMQKWEQDWKGFCDNCQDLEEERVEFMKDNMWAYANAVSTVCVSDDESCEKMRLALEQLEPEKDMENFVREYGTGNAILEPPVFVNYANTDASPVSSTRAVTRPANFVRSSQRPAVSRGASLPQDDDPYDDTNHAGVGAGGGGPSRSTPPESVALSRSATQRSMSGRSQANGINGHVSPPHDPQRRNSTASGLVKPTREIRGAGDPLDPTVSSTQLVIGNQAWNVDPNDDPQQKTNQLRASPPAGDQDPLAQHMAELNNAVAASGAGRRNTIRRNPQPSSIDSRKGTGDSLATPSSGTSAISANHFRNSAEVVVGSYPLAPSRSTSPNPVAPRAALAGPPQTSVPPPASNVSVEKVLNDYSRPFPGEPRSRANSYVGPPPPSIANQNQDQVGPRPTSRGGYPGVGTQSLINRAPSPARGPSPTAMQPYRGPPAPSTTSLNRSASITQRPVTPNNPVGIALGPDGRVVHDMMIQPVQRQPSSHYGQPNGPPQPTQPPHPYSYNEPSRALTHQQQQPPRNDYGAVAPNPYGTSQPPYGNYVHPPQHPAYENQLNGAYQQPPPPPANYNNYGAMTRNPSTHNVMAVNHAQAQPQRYYGTPNNAVYRAPSPAVARSPSPGGPRGHPPPTGAYTDDGRPILFYVKALYDYAATIDEEFDFQSGDIIAVTDTPEDGWWSGELLDEARRQTGRHVFPSNFVCLF
ncbi:hypothetical protein BDN67DRAFT_939263 [Paxillus ammoniavirescens]|nr:hypothetical protein BDN67DRAFT_939263 [Paxillus ammoniavirescens]